jgi:hypothetical protein
MVVKSFNYSPCVTALEILPLFSYYTQSELPIS